MGKSSIIVGARPFSRGKFFFKKRKPRKSSFQKAKGIAYSPDFTRFDETSKQNKQVKEF